MSNRCSVGESGFQQLAVSSLNESPLFGCEIELVHRLEASVSIFTPKDKQTWQTALVANHGDVLVHFVWTLGLVIYPTLSCLIDNDLRPGLCN